MTRDDDTERGWNGSWDFEGVEALDGDLDDPVSGDFTLWMDRLYEGYVERLLRFLRAEHQEEGGYRDGFWEETKGDFVVSQDLIFLGKALMDLPDRLNLHPSRRLIDALYYAPEVFLQTGLFEYFRQHLDQCERCAGYLALVSGEAEAHLIRELNGLGQADE